MGHSVDAVAIIKEALTELNAGRIEAAKGRLDLLVATMRGAVVGRA